MQKERKSDMIQSMSEFDPLPQLIIDDSEIARLTLTHLRSSGMPLAQLLKFEHAFSYNALDREAFEVARLNCAIMSLEEDHAVEMLQAIKRGSLLAFMSGREASAAYHIPHRFVTKAWLETTTNSWRLPVEPLDENIPPLTAMKHQLREQATGDFTRLSRPLQELVADYYTSSQEENDFDSLMIGFGLVMPTLHEQLELLARTEQELQNKTIEDELHEILIAGL